MTYFKFDCVISLLSLEKTTCVRELFDFKNRKKNVMMCHDDQTTWWIKTRHPMQILNSQKSFESI